MTLCPPIDSVPALRRARYWSIALVLGLMIAVTGWLIRDSDRALAEIAAPAPEGGPAIRALRDARAQPGVPVNDRTVVPDAVRLALSDVDPAVRLEAIGMLEDRADIAAGEMLAQSLSDPDVRVRRIAVEALASMPAAAAAAPLQRALHDEDESVRLSAADALADIGGDVIFDAMLIALHDRHADVRMTVVDNLGDMGDPRALNLLQLALGDSDPAIRAAAADYLRQ